MGSSEFFRSDLQRKAAAQQQLKMDPSTQADYEKGPEVDVEHGSGSSRRKRLLIPLALVALLAVAGGITAWQVTKDRSTTSSDGAFAKPPHRL